MKTTAPLLNPSNKRGNWLGKVVEQLKQAINENDTETFENLYTDTMTTLHYKYKEAKQLMLPLHPACHPERSEGPCISQLRLFNQ